MSDRHAEGLAKAGRALFEREYSFDWHAENLADGMSVESSFIREADAAVTAYLEHAHPEVTSAEELDALPVGAILHDREGAIWETGHEDGIDYLCRVGHEEGYGSSEVPLPARVIWWPDNA